MSKWRVVLIVCVLSSFGWAEPPEGWPESITMFPGTSYERVYEWNSSGAYFFGMDWDEHSDSIGVEEGDPVGYGYFQFESPSDGWQAFSYEVTNNGVDDLSVTAVGVTSFVRGRFNDTFGTSFSSTGAMLDGLSGAGAVGQGLGWGGEVPEPESALGLAGGAAFFTEAVGEATGQLAEYAPAAIGVGIACLGLVVMVRLNRHIPAIARMTVRGK